MKAPINTGPLYVISDIHLGCNTPRAYPKREQKLISFIQSLEGSASQLIICGDFFEFWMEYADYINKNHFATLCALKNLRDSGTQIHYLAGNHDFNLGTFFDSIGIITHPHEYRCVSGDKSLYITHGDGMDPADWKYRIVKKIIRHPLSNFLFKIIHPDWGMALARLVGSGSRYAQADTPVNIESYSAAAIQRLEQEQCDVFIQGHTHQRVLNTIGDKTFINCGDWLFGLHYLEIEAGIATQKEWQ